MKPNSLLQTTGLGAIAILCFAFNLSTTTPVPPNASFDDVNQAGFVNANFTSLDGHSGTCVLGTFTNTSSQPLSFVVEPGRRLVSDNDENQDIMLTREAQVILASGETAKVPLYGFCTQAHNSSPDGGDGFSAGYMVSENALRLSNFLAQNKFPQRAEQNAVWCISDDYDVSRIDYHDLDSVEALIEYVADLKGVPVPRYTMDYVEDEEGMPTEDAISFRSRITYEAYGADMLHVVVYDKYGIGVQRQWLEIPANAESDRHTLSMDVSNLPKGHYYVKVYTKGVAQVDEFSLDV